MVFRKSLALHLANETYASTSLLLSFRCLLFEVKQLHAHPKSPCLQRPAKQTDRQILSGPSGAIGLPHSSKYQLVLPLFTWFFPWSLLFQSYTRKSSNHTGLTRTDHVTPKSWQGKAGPQRVIIRVIIPPL